MNSRPSMVGERTFRWLVAKARVAAVVAVALVVSACGGGSNEESKRFSLSTVGASELVALDGDIKSLVKVGELRVSRTIYEYRFRIVLNPGSIDATNVVASIQAAGIGTTILQGTIYVGTVSAGINISPPDTITLRHDRTKPFDPAALRWQIVGLPATRPLPPVLQFAGASGDKSITATWQLTSNELNYEVHASVDRNFVPNLSTLRSSWRGTGSAQIGGLLPSTHYTVKIVAVSSTGLRSEASNPLQIRTLSREPVLKAGVTIARDIDLDLLPVEILDDRISFQVKQDARIPANGSYIYGQASAAGNSYLRRVVGSTASLGLLHVITSSADLTDVIDLDELSFSFGGVTIPAADAATTAGAALMRKPLKDRRSNSLLPRTCTIDVSGLSLPEPVVRFGEFAPDINFHIGTEAGTNSRYFEGTLSAAVPAEIKFQVDIASVVNGSCSWSFPRVPSPSFPLWLGPIVVFVGATFEPGVVVILESPGSLKMNLDASGELKGEAKVRVSFSGEADVSQSFDVLNEKLSAPLDPGLLQIGKSRAFAGLELTVTGTIYGRDLAKAGFRFGANGVRTVEHAKGFLRQLQPELTELTKLKAEVLASLFYGIEINAFVAKWLGIEVSISEEVPLQQDSFFETPSLRLEIGPGIVDGSLNEAINYLMKASQYSQVRADWISQEIQWNIFPLSSVDGEQPQPGQVMAPLRVVGQVCAAFSAVDDLTGEGGRRFSNILTVGDDQVIDFGSDEVVSLGDGIFEVGPYVIYSPRGSSIKDGRLVVDQEFYRLYGSDIINIPISISRKDGASFSIQGANLRVEHVNFNPIGGNPLPPSVGMAYRGDRSGDDVFLPPTLPLAPIPGAVFSFGETLRFPFLKGTPMSLFSFWFYVQGSYDSEGRSYFIRNSIANIVAHLECE